MALGGYADRLGWINLSTGEVRYEVIPEEWKEKYIGARGMGVRYLLDADPKCDPYGPENRLCFMNGPLTGSLANMSGRLAVVTKSPLTGGVVDSHQGGWSAARLRWAGFDGLVFEGISATPVYAYIENGTLELRDASTVWGKSVHETIRFFQHEFGEKDLTVITIGQAGENLVRYAAWLNEHDRAAGRGGTGAVGGAKKLKAIVIKAEKVLPQPVNKEDFKKAYERARHAITVEGSFTQPRKGGLSTLGTNVLMNITASIGALPTNNGQQTSFARAELVSGEHIRDTILVEEPTCHACPVACKKLVETEYDGVKVRTESFEYETAWAFGPNCGVDSKEAVAMLIQLCNQYGLDTIEMGNALSTYMEISTSGWNGAVPLTWGDHKKMVELVSLTALREGIGDKLAEGPARLAAAYGHPEVANTVRGQAIPAYDPRGLKGMGLGYATSNRGACHLRAYTPASELKLIPLPTDPLAWKGKGELLKLLQDIHAFSDSLDLCKFSAFVEGTEEYAEQYAAFVGRADFTAADVLKVGERIYNLERYYNQLAGEQPGSDTLPRRFTHEPSTMGGSVGHICELDLMLEEYYQQRGWEVGGVVGDAKLKELGIL